MAKPKDDTLPATVNTVTGEIVENTKAPAVLNDEALGQLVDFTSAMAALEAAGIVAESADNYGTGFEVADKATLCDIPLIFLQWRFTDGDFGTFVTIHAMTESGRKVIINDGSSGIRLQLETITRTRIQKGVPPEKAYSGLLVKRGLTRSDYDYVSKNSKGEDVTTKATTYYVSI